MKSPYGQERERKVRGERKKLTVIDVSFDRNTVAVSGAPLGTSRDEKMRALRVGRDTCYYAVPVIIVVDVDVGG